MDQVQKEQGFEEWAIVEVMGHQTYAGRVTEQTIAGQAFVRVDVPEIPSDEDAEAVVGFTKFLGSGSIYAITPTTEEVARAAVRRLRKTPITVYMPELHPPAATRPALHAGDDEDEW